MDIRFPERHMGTGRERAGVANVFSGAGASFPRREWRCSGATGAIDIRSLRRIKLLSYFTDEQLERFTQFVVAEQMPQGPSSSNKATVATPCMSSSRGNFQCA